MSVYYEMSGNAQVRWTMEVSEIIERFNEKGGEIEIEILENNYVIGDVVTVQVHGMTNCTYGTTKELESIIRELNPFVVGIGQVVWDTNDGYVVGDYHIDDGVIYLGSDNSMEDYMNSASALSVIKDVSFRLTNDHREEAIAYLMRIT